MASRKLSGLLVVFSGAFAASLLFNILYVSPEITGDAKDYILIANGLAKNGSWLTFGRPPLFPVVLAILSKLGFGLFQTSRMLKNQGNSAVSPVSGRLWDPYDGQIR